MFVHSCTSCGKRQLTFPSQLSGVTHTDEGMVVSFTCWCGATQTLDHSPFDGGRARDLVDA
ncbi:hypothetical protein FE634_02190 [Nocardioides dongxiaopingii]|jgi:hypothetical protein|uniref:hypothetical protein n=1 Tax=Nocardioides TaxID=1839 RepID=UPI0010C76234|nr:MULTISPECIES: hypothetical protein [Nocardioides]QCW49516.2 hypothetical protein FE634_02190 [Nocardioides sp. S-1144]